MDITELKIINIKNDFRTYQIPWYRCLEYINNNCQSDKLYKNYVNINLDQFICFSCIFHKEEIVSFGGIEYAPDKWGADLCRVLTRFWIHPSKRSQALTKWDESKIRFSPLVLKHQLDFLKSHRTISLAMITREGNYTKSFHEIIRLSNTVSDTPFEIQPGKYNVCHPLEYCPQMIALRALNSSMITDTLAKTMSQGFLKRLE